MFDGTETNIGFLNGFDSANGAFKPIRGYMKRVWAMRDSGVINSLQNYTRTTSYYYIYAVSKVAC